MLKLKKQASYSAAVIGAGQIGRPISTLLSQNPLVSKVTLYDKHASPGVTKLDVLNIGDLAGAVAEHDLVISALPYDVTVPVAETAASQGGKIYFDLTEDLGSGHALRKLNETYDRGTIMVPHCGLAPGAVSIIASSLAKPFSRIDDIKIRVGALPIASDNSLLYHRSWSTVGLVNEYTKPCRAIRSGEEVITPPLQDLTTVNIDGFSFEAFNTSGGSGTLHETLLSSGLFKGDMAYQTMRYPGHNERIRFLLEEMGFKRRLPDLVSLLDREVPRTVQDVVVVLIQVTGQCNGHEKFIRTYSKKMYGTPDFSAIQLTTAGGVVAVASALVQRAVDGTLSEVLRGGSENGTGWIANEDLSLAEVAFHSAWAPY